MFKVYGGQGCMWCVRATELLAENNLEYFYYDVHSDKEALEVLKKHNLRSIPQVFTTDGTYIGGFEELKKFVEKQT